MIRPWFVRAVQASPLGPVATGTCVTALLLATNLAFYAGERLDLLLYMPIGIGYLLAASALSARALVRDLRALRPALDAPASELVALEAWSGRYPRALLGIATAAGLGLAVSLGTFAGGPRGPSVWIGLLVGESLLFWSIAGPVMALLVVDARRLRELGRRWLVPQLFEPRLLAPFGRAGLRGGLVILGIFGLRILFYTIEAPHLLVLANLGPMVVAAGLATAALVLPSLGARATLREAKRRELERIRDALERQPFGPGASLEAGVPRGYLDLLAYRDRVEAVREWPLDAPALLRFAFYLLIPLLGWVGGALVERLLSLFLD